MHLTRTQLLCFWSMSWLYLTTGLLLKAFIVSVEHYWVETKANSFVNSREKQFNVCNFNYLSIVSTSKE